MDRYKLKKLNQFTLISNPVGATFVGYKSGQDVRIDFSSMIPLFGVTNDTGSSETLAISQKAFTESLAGSSPIVTGVFAGSAIPATRLKNLGYFNFLYSFYYPMTIEAGYGYVLSDINKTAKTFSLYKRVIATEVATSVAFFSVLAAFGDYTIMKASVNTAAYAIVNWNKLTATTVSSVLISEGAELNPAFAKNPSIDSINTSIANLATQIAPISTGIFAGTKTPASRLKTAGYFNFLFSLYHPMTMETGYGYVLTTLDKTAKTFSLYKRLRTNESSASVAFFTVLAEFGDYTLMKTSTNTAAYAIVNWNNLTVDTVNTVLLSEGAELNPAFAKNPSIDRINTSIANLATQIGPTSNLPLLKLEHSNPGYYFLNSRLTIGTVFDPTRATQYTTSNVGWSYTRLKAGDVITVDFKTWDTFGSDSNKIAIVNPTTRVVTDLVTIVDKGITTYTATADCIVVISILVRTSTVTLSSLSAFDVYNKVFLLQETVKNLGSENAPKPQILNNRLPLKTSTTDGVKILFIGSSWGEDTWYFFNKVAKTSGIDNVKIGAYFMPSGSFTMYLDAFTANTPVSFSYSEDGSNWAVENKTLLAGITQEPWDIVVIMQRADNSYWYNRYQPGLTNWIKTLKLNLTNPRPTFALNCTWVPKAGSSYITDWGFTNQTDMYLAAFSAYNQASLNSGIDVIIPGGAAVYAARSSSLNTPSDLTRDDLHLDLGIGRYLTACNMFQALMAPIYGVSVLGNPFRPTSGTPVTDDNAPLIQQCALVANANRFGLNDMSI